MLSMPVARAPRRPGLACALAFCLGIAACHSGRWLPWVVACACALVLAWTVVRIEGFTLCVLLACAVLGWIRFQVSEAPTSMRDLRFHQDSGGPVILYGHTYHEADVRPDETRWIISVDSIAYPDSVTPRSGRVLVRFRFDPGIPPESEVELCGRLKPPEPPHNPGDFSWKDYLHKKGIHALFEPATGSPVLHVTTATPGFLGSVVAPMRRVLKDRLGAHLEGEERALAAGLLLGERSELSPETVEAFRSTGTLHLLAVSGSNVGVVAAMIWGVLLLLRFGRVLRLVAAAACIVLFCCLAHLESSVVRAGGAALLVLGGSTLRRRIDPIQVWGLVLWGFAAWDPSALLDLGFQLSFSATLGLLLLPDKLSESSGSWLRKGLRLVFVSVLVSTAAQLATLPFLLAIFSEVPLVTPLANLLCVPLAGLATVAAMLVLLLAPLGEPILGMGSAALWASMKSLLFVVHGVHDLGVAVLDVPRPGMLLLGVLSALVVSILVFANSPRHRRRLMLGTLLSLTLLPVLARPSRDPEVVVLDGPGLTAWVRLSATETWLVSSRVGPPAAPVLRAARSLGWAGPTRTLVLNDSVEAGTQTSPVSKVYVHNPARGDRVPLLTIWESAHDSLPFGVLLTYEGGKVVLARKWPALSWDSLGIDSTVVWATDCKEGRPPSIDSWSGMNTILSGRGHRKSRDSVPNLHTSQAGSIRIFWRDGRFQTEPSIR